MNEASRHDAWQSGGNYDNYMGRWSRRIAPRFVEWIEPAPRGDWLDVGCGTGELSNAIVAHCDPKSLIGIDPSDGFLSKARDKVRDDRVDFVAGQAEKLPFPSESFDVVVSGLMVNFVSDRLLAVSEMRRVARRGATVAFYVWDYPGGGVEFMRAFWAAAVDLDPTARDFGEDKRFPYCTRDGLAALAENAGLAGIDVTAIEAQTLFRDFDDFWRPFTLGTGPAPGYCASLSPGAREQLRSRLRTVLPYDRDGSIPLKVRAWGVRGRAP
ncbi:class I SAM-dependent methyltransferase [Pseudorhizobium halotolerans]|nr:class I SAM-dependent methyltransferase [Pseudorhizobium halotolerans]